MAGHWTWAVVGLSHLVIWCFAKKLYIRCDTWVGALLWWSCQSPVVHSCGLLNYPDSFLGGILKPKTKFDAYSLLYSLILNVMATQYTSSLNGIYCPHWLEQWSHHCSCMRILVHSPWLTGYIDVVQTILIILTMAGLFLDRPRIVQFLQFLSTKYYLKDSLQT